MTVLSEFTAGNILAKTKTFTVVSGSTLPESGSFSLCPFFLITKAESDKNLRLRLFSTPRILDATDSITVNEKARPFGSVTGSAPDTQVADDLIIDLDFDTLGAINMVPSLFGGHSSTGSDEIYYYLQPWPSTTESVAISSGGTITVHYLQLAVNTGSVRISQSLAVPAGTGGVSGSFTTPTIYAILSGSVSGSSSWIGYSRLRIYQDEASMNAPGEIDRAFESPITASYQYISGSDFLPFSGSGIIVDVYFSGSIAGSLFPINVGANMHTIPVTQSWYRYEPGASLAGADVGEFTLQIVELNS